MNIRDSYIHGTDGKGVVKSMYFATTAESVLNLSGTSYNTAAGKDLVFLLADGVGTKIGLPIPILNQNTTGYAGSLMTVKSTSTNNHYLTFVDTNNTTATAESFYTSGDIYFKPSTGVLTVKGVTVSASSGFNYSGIETATANSARPVWFAYDGRNGTPCVNADKFTYNPSTNTLKVGALDGPTIVIGDTTLYINSTGTTNKLTPDTSISNLSTNGTIPSSKAVYDAILNGIASNDAMVFKGLLTGGADAAHTAYTPAADCGWTYKVGTAGYINGTYYQVNDTFICTTDGTVAAGSSNVATVKANWSVVEGNGDYLSYKGGTMYGNLSWNGTTALPTVTTASSILVVDSNITKQISLANLLTALNLAPSISNGTTANTIKITVGGVDSSNYTVPYASYAANADTVDNIHASEFYNENFGDKWHRLRTSNTSTEWGNKWIKVAVFNNQNPGQYSASKIHGYFYKHNCNWRLRQTYKIPFQVIINFTEDTADFYYSVLGSTENLRLIKLGARNYEFQIQESAHIEFDIFYQIINPGNVTGYTEITAGTTTYISVITPKQIESYGNYSYKSIYATNLSEGTQGSIPYQTNASTTTFLAGGSNNLVLRYDGTNKKPYWGADIDTWRNIYVGGTLKMTTATNTKALNFKAGSNITLSYLGPGTTGGSTDSGSNDYGTIIITASNQIPSNNVTGSGTNGFITKWTGTNTIGNLVAISSAVSSQTTSTKFLREDGTWAVPSYTTNSDKTGIKLVSSISGTKKTDSTLIITNSSTGLQIKGGTNLFQIGDGTNYVEVAVGHGLNTKNLTAAGSTYAIYTSASSLPNLDNIYLALVNISPSISNGSTPNTTKITIGNVNSNDFGINADKLDGYHLSSIVDKSGENLIVGSSFASTTGWSENGWNGGGMSTEDVENGIYNMQATNGWRSFSYALPSYCANKVISYSFDAKIVSSKTTNPTWRINVGKDNGHVTVHDITSKVSIDNWSHVSGTLTCDATPYFNIAVWGTDGSGNTVWMNIKDLKVELGDLPSIWTPSPYDIYKGIPTTIFSGSQTLIVSSWTPIAAIDSYQTGTYTISINSSDLLASGIFSVCGGTDIMGDEIVLHVSNKTSGVSWRPYARVSGKNLELSCNEATGTARTYTVKILKLI